MLVEVLAPVLGNDADPRYTPGHVTRTIINGELMHRRIPPKTKGGHKDNTYTDGLVYRALPQTKTGQLT